jgi:hypothetical protein
MDIIGESVGSFLRGLGAFLPNILAAIVIMLVGWVIARLLRSGVTQGLTTLVYWLVMLIVLVTAVNALRLEVASRLLNQILLYIPNIIAAVIVVVVGLYAAGFVATLVRTAAANAGIEEAGFVGGIARYALIVFTFAIALNQLGIGRNVIGPAVLILIGAAGAAAAIAVGLGSKDLVAKYLQKRFGKL